MRPKAECFGKLHDEDTRGLGVGGERGVGNSGTHRRTKSRSAWLAGRAIGAITGCGNNRRRARACFAQKQLPKTIQIQDSDELSATLQQMDDPWEKISN